MHLHGGNGMAVATFLTECDHNHNDNSKLFIVLL